MHSILCWKRNAVSETQKYSPPTGGGANVIIQMRDAWLQDQESKRQQCPLRLEARVKSLFKMRKACPESITAGFFITHSDLTCRGVKLTWVMTTSWQEAAVVFRATCPSCSPPIAQVQCLMGNDLLMTERSTWLLRTLTMLWFFQLCHLPNTAKYRIDYFFYPSEVENDLSQCKISKEHFTRMWKTVFLRCLTKHFFEETLNFQPK